MPSAETEGPALDKTLLKEYMKVDSKVTFIHALKYRKIEKVRYC